MEQAALPVSFGHVALLLWVAFLILLAFVLRGMESMEPDRHEAASVIHLRNPAERSPRFDKPEQVSEPIGWYMEAPIFRSIYIGGVEYLYDRIDPSPDRAFLDEDERCIAPGVVYRRV